MKNQHNKHDHEQCSCHDENQCHCENKDCEDTCQCENDVDVHSDQVPADQVELDPTQTLINDYKHQIELANDKISELSLEVIKLKQEILKAQEDYKVRLEQKALEANEKVAAKRQELEDRLAQEIEIKKHKLISNDMQQLFATIDQFENVINAPNSDPQVSAYIAGFKMLLSLFEQSLTNLGISRIMVKQGDKFDADIMAAIDGIESDQFPKGTVVRVQSPAYVYNEKVVKHAIVIVSK